MIKTERARKTGEGSITYAVLKDADSQSVYFTLLANDGSGQFSPEIVAFEKIQQCLAKVDGKKPVPAKLFAPAFVGRSANNAGFLMAAMRQELLVLPTVDASHLHAVSGNWDEWKRQILAQEGQPYTPPAPKGKGGFAPAAPVDTQPKPEAVVNDKSMPEADIPPLKGKKSRKLLHLAKTPVEATPDAVDATDTANVDAEAVSHDDAA
ncbi:hypothetical protein [Polaromonas sp. DSR2-3-2]|uniref:hypothetical protein n=1 Tax=unclassified Polaromonas TaxID=2638319 RepID=UPI003CE96A58